MKRSNRLIHATFVIMLFTLISLIYVISSSAQVNAYTTEKWDTQVTVNKDYTFDYVETITVNFDYKQHGIFRYIPLDGRYRIKDIKVDGDPYKLDKEDESRIIQIGSADKYLTGRHTYTIRYSLKFVEDHYSNADLMYIDLLPTEWQTPIDNVSVHMQLPEDFDMMNFSFYTGRYGSTEDLADYASIKINEDKCTVDIEGKNFDSNQGITVYKTLPDGYWSPTISTEWIKTLLIALFVLMIIYMFVMRTTVGKDPAIVPTVEFYPPEGLPPHEIGYIVDGVVDTKDITSIFFYLASRGYIKIKEISTGSFKFERTKILPDYEHESTKKFFKAIFGNKAYEETDKPLVKRSSEIKERLGRAYESIPDLVSDHYSGEKSLHSSKSTMASGISTAMYVVGSGVLILLDMIYYSFQTEVGLWPLLLISAVVSLAFGAIITWMKSIHDHRLSRKASATTVRWIGCLLVYAVACLIMLLLIGEDEIGFGDKYVTGIVALFYVFAPILILGMRARTEDNARLLGQILGFKNFIRTAEIDKLNELVEENPDYFYDILPYAYVFGLTKKWASNFESIHVDNPTWYETSTGAFTDVNRFNVVVMNHMFDNMNRTISNAVAYSKDSGGGGFSSGGGGGGFSGGGGGGGGGGAW